MEELFIYLLKSSGLLSAFFLAYHFLLRKETFFNSNRWFLLAGLVTSATLPLFFIKKIVWIERPKVAMADIIAISNSKRAAGIIPTTPTIQLNGLFYFCTKRNRCLNS